MNLQKRKPYKSKKITQSARGEDCTFEFPGCENKTETTVFCHMNEGYAGKGLGQKADDFAGGYGCCHCHDVLDKRKDIGLKDSEIDWYMLRALYRTFRRLLDNGILK